MFFFFFFGKKLDQKKKKETTLKNDKSYIFFKAIFIVFKGKSKGKMFFLKKKLDKEQNEHLGISITYVTCTLETP